MNRQLDALLCENFPALYQNRDRGIVKSAMTWGFCVGDGWFPIIWRLSQKLEPIAQVDGLRAEQVKEKFGSLRFYTNIDAPEIDAAIEEAERESARTCEKCGEPGKIGGKHWAKCLCEKCIELG
jgi:hypothetical protein